MPQAVPHRSIPAIAGLQKELGQKLEPLVPVPGRIPCGCASPAMHYSTDRAAPQEPPYTSLARNIHPANASKHTALHHHLPLTSKTSLLGLLSNRSPSDQGFDLGKCRKSLRILFVTSPKQAAAPAFLSVILWERRLRASQAGRAEMQRASAQGYICFHKRPFLQRR